MIAKYHPWPLQLHLTAVVISPKVVSDSYNPVDCSLPGSSFHRISQADSLNHSIPAAMIFFLYLEYWSMFLPQDICTCCSAYLDCSSPGPWFKFPDGSISHTLNSCFYCHLFPWGPLLLPCIKLQNDPCCLALPNFLPPLPCTSVITPGLKQGQVYHRCLMNTLLNQRMLSYF